MIGAKLTGLEREVCDMVERIRKMEEISVPDAGKLLKKTPRWVRDNLPVIIHTRKSHGVRLVDIEAYQQRRTIRPEKNGAT